MIKEINQYCIFCKSSKVIRHGHTSTGNKRYRCRSCGKTWVQEKMEQSKPDMSYIVEEYLKGKTCRDLVSVYRSSPLRINQKIREFLHGCPPWEDYLDLSSTSHEPKLVYCIGRPFSCSSGDSNSNTKYLAMTVDALSTCVLGFEIGESDSKEVWYNLLHRMKQRRFLCNTFMTNGSTHLEDALFDTYPDASMRIYYLRAIRDKEVACCIDRFPNNPKLLSDAIKSYETMRSQDLEYYLERNYGKRFKDFLNSNSESLMERIRQRLESRPKIRLEGMISAFQKRFEKFHMLKDNPYPLVNGWIAHWMLDTLEFGFSRLSLYLQSPVHTEFKNFSCGQIPLAMKLTESSNELRNFVVEIAARCVQIPVFFSKCDMNLEKCSLF